MTARCGHNAAVRYWRTFGGRMAYQLFCQGCGEELASGKAPLRTILHGQLLGLSLIAGSLLAVIVLLVVVTP